MALTFDAGSDVGHTQQVLDLLRAKGVLATFGLTGLWVRANPVLARRIVTDGHQVVNHTDRHLSFTGRSTGTAPLTRAQRTEALAAAETAIRSIAGTAALPWFRPPYGDRDAGVDRDVGAAGYPYELMWTVDTLGWKGVPPAEVTSRVLSAATPGEIVLMHVGADSTDWQALADVVDGLRAKGYAFVRADAFSRRCSLDAQMNSSCAPSVFSMKSEALMMPSTSSRRSSIVSLFMSADIRQAHR